jgi:ATP-dependent DNA ligase I
MERVVDASKSPHAGSETNGYHSDDDNEDDDDDDDAAAAADDDDDRTVQLLHIEPVVRMQFQAICGDSISDERIQELLEAGNGSVERAIDLYFHQEKSVNDTPEKIVPKPTCAVSKAANAIIKSRRGASGNKKRTLAQSKLVSPSSGGKKQARIDAFFVTSPLPRNVLSMSHSSSSANATGMDTKQTTAATKFAAAGIHKVNRRNKSSGMAQPRDDDDDDENHVTNSLPETNPDETASRDQQAPHQALHTNETISDRLSSARQSPATKRESKVVGDEDTDKATTRTATTTSSTKTRSTFASTKEMCAMPNDSFVKKEERDIGTPNIENRCELLPPSPNQSAHGTRSIHSFAYLADILDQIATTSKRLVKLDILSHYLRELRQATQTPHHHDSEKFVVTTYLTPSPPPEDIARIMACALYLVLGRPTSIQHAALNIGGMVISNSLQIVLGTTRMQLSKEYRKLGDMGEAAASLFQQKNAAKAFFVVPNTKSKSLQVITVYDTLQALANDDSNGSRDAKQRVVLQLLRSCHTKNEINFLVRLLLGNMRIGASLKTILAALATAFTTSSTTTTTRTSSSSSSIQQQNSGTDKAASSGMSPAEATKLLQRTHDICPNLQLVVSALLQGGWEQLRQKCSIQVMTPIAPMLAHPIHALSDISQWMTKHGNEAPGQLSKKDMKDDGIDTVAVAIMEWKYDGVRAQIHCNGRDIKIFSRHLLDSTDQFPDAAQFLRDACGASSDISFIMDAEIVGVAELSAAGTEEGTMSSSLSTTTKPCEVRLLPFQDLSKRKRKYSEKDNMAQSSSGSSGEVRIKVFGFDLMYWDGQSLMDWPLWRRQELLRQKFQETQGYAMVSSQQLYSYDESRLRRFLEAAFRGGAEGLMLKINGLSSLVSTNGDVSAPNTVDSASKVTKTRLM